MTRRDTWHHSNVPEPSLNPPEPPICRAMYRTGDESPEWFRGRWRRCTEYMPCPIHPIHDDDESSIGTTTIPRVTQGKRKTKMVKAKFTVTEVTHVHWSKESVRVKLMPQYDTTIWDEVNKQ